MPRAELTIDGLPDSFSESLQRAEAAYRKFEKAQKAILENAEKSEKQQLAELRQLEKLEKARRSGLTTSERTIAKLVDHREQQLLSADAAEIQADAIKELTEKGMEQLRRETANAGRSLSMLFDEQNKHLESIEQQQVELKTYAELQAEATEAVADNTASVSQQILVMGEQAQTSMEVLEALRKIEAESTEVTQATEQYAVMIEGLTGHLKALEKEEQKTRAAIERQTTAIEKEYTQFEKLNEVLQAATKAVADNTASVSEQTFAMGQQAQTSGEVVQALLQLRDGASDAEKATEQYTIMVGGLITRLKDLEAEEKASREATERNTEALQEQRRQVQLLEDIMAQAQEAVEQNTASVKQQIFVAAQAAESSEDLSLAIAELKTEFTEAEKAGEKYQLMIKKLEQRQEKLRLEEKKLAKAQDEITDKYEKQKQRLDALETTMDAFKLPGAGMVTTAKMVADAMETINEKGTGAQASLLKGGIAVGVFAGGALAASAAGAGLAAMLLKNAADADELNQELIPLGMNLEAIEAAGVDRAAAGLDAALASGNALRVQIASELSPEIQQVGRYLTASGLAAIDSFKNFAKGKDVFEVLIELLAKGMVGAIETLVSPFKNLALLGTLATDALGITDDATLSLQSSFEELSDTVTNNTIAGLNALAHEGFDELHASTSDYLGEADKFIDKQLAINVASRESAEVVKAQVKSLDSLEQSVARLIQSGYTPVEQAEMAALESSQMLEEARRQGMITNEEYARGLEAVSMQITAAYMREASAAESAGVAKAQAAKESAKAELATKRNAADASIQLASAVSSILTDIAEQGGRQANAARVAAAVIDVGISTAQAAMQSFATLGPPVPPNMPGIVGMAAVGVQSLASLAQIRRMGGGGGGSSKAMSSGSAGSGSSANKGAQVRHEQAMPVTDANMPRGMGDRLALLTEGDQVRRSGRLGQTVDENPRMVKALERNTEEIRRGNSIMEALFAQQSYQQHQASRTRPRNLNK